MTSLKSSPISAMIQGGSAIMLSPRRMIVVFGSIAVTTVLEMDVRSMATGAGCWAAILPATLSWNDCVSAVLKRVARSEEHTSELQSLRHLVCRLLLEKK